MNLQKNIRELQYQIKTDGWRYASMILYNKCKKRKLKYIIEHFQSNPFNNEIKDLAVGITNWKYYAYLQAEFRDELIVDQKVEKLTDTPKIIWWCWLQGIEDAPDLCRACLASLRRCFPDYEIRIVSLENINNYVNIPEFIIAKFQEKKMGAAHFSDILRTCLLVEYGGIWIDSTVYVSQRPDEDLLRSPLFFYSTYMRQDLSMAGSNWLIVAAKKHPVLCLQRKLLLSYWHKYDWDIHYYIFHFFFHMALERYRELWEKVPIYSNIPPHIMQRELFDSYNEERFRQISNMSAFHKLTHHKEAYPDGDLSETNYGHIINQFLGGCVC